jgi:peroxiredoxin
MRLQVGTFIPPLTLETVNAGTIGIPDSRRPVHLQFRRFAGCPICNLHLQTIVKRHAEIVGAGILEVVVFHSTAEEMREFSGLPFAIVADPARRLYQRFGVEQAPRAVLDPRSWPAAVIGLLDRVRNPDLARPSLGTAARGGPFGLPADFLIGPDGRLHARKYGAHADDQWSVDELLELAAGVGR